MSNEMENLIETAHFEPEKLIFSHPDLLADLYPEWMARNRAAWMAENRPEWLIQYMRAVTPAWMAFDPAEIKSYRNRLPRAKSEPSRVTLHPWDLEAIEKINQQYSGF